MKKYNACDFFITRIPLLPINNYFDVFSESSVTDIKNSLFSLFQESFLNETLAIASKDLFEAINKIDEIDHSKSSEQIISTLVKYYIRLTTRPTPFGLFSGVSVGKFGDESNIIVSQDFQHIKRARADMEWIYGVIKEIESNEDILNSLSVRFNDFTYINGNRLEKPNKTFLQLNADKEELSTSIRYTSQVKVVEKISENFIQFSDLVKYLSTQNQGVPFNRIETFIAQLLENEFLLSELRPPLINVDVLNYVVNILSCIKENEAISQYVSQLNSIAKSISEYNSTYIGNGIDIFKTTIQKMQDLYVAKNYLQVDMKSKMISNMLSYDLKKELEQFVSAMCKIAPSYRVPDEYAHYISLFVEQYGYGAEISVLELLDIDKGLGAPSYYLDNTINRTAPKRQKTRKELRLETLLERKLLSTLRENGKSFEINDDDINYITGDEIESDIYHPMDYLQSFELFLIAHPSNKESINNTDYCFTLAPVFASDGVGKSFGRFRDMLSDEEALLFYKEFEKQKKLLSEYVIAEIAELPEKGRTSNVSASISNYDYQIMLTTNYCEDKKSLSIRDLYIGVDPSNGQFYIRSKSLNKKIIVTMTSMLNPLSGSTAVRFLREVSSVRRFDITRCISSIINTSHEYYPRITYKRIIIKPETWVISKDILGLENNTKDIFIEKFDAFKKKWDIPRYVFLTEFDNRLLLDLENPLHVNEIFHILRKENALIKLAEMTCNYNDYASKDLNNRHYVTEVVVPFVLSTDNTTADEKEKDNLFFTTKSDIHLNCMKTDREKLIILPGKENWLFFKLYGCSKRQNELISVVYENFEKLINSNKAQKYFFIRYSDPEPHLRVRIQAAGNELFYVFEYLTDWLENIRKEGLISKAVIDTYQRETERYGGIELIEKAEEYFFHDSRTVMKIINKQRIEKLQINLNYIGISFIIMALSSFRLSMEDIEPFLSTIGNQNLLRKEFQNDRKMFISAVNNNNNWQEIRSSIDYPEVYDYLTALSIKLTDYADAVYESDENGLVTNSIRDIVIGVIHMFCNRLVGGTF